MRLFCKQEMVGSIPTGSYKGTNSIVIQTFAWVRIPHPSSSWGISSIGRAKLLMRYCLCLVKDMFSKTRGEYPPKWFVVFLYVGLQTKNLNISMSCFGRKMYTA